MHRTNADFWKEYRALPADIRERAVKQFALLKANPRHPSLQFKKLTEHRGQEIWCAQVNPEIPLPRRENRRRLNLVLDWRTRHL
jgi:hypothetical protein